MKWMKYILIGFFFGVLIVKSEALSWFRIQEMFRFQSFHMFGIFGSAIAVGAVTVWLIRKYKLKTMEGEAIELGKKPLQPRAQLLGGIMFGFGWVLTGCCIAPIFALAGTGYQAPIFILGGALLGVWTYGLVREKLPH